MIQDKFVNRHNGPRETEINQMLKKIGASTLEELIQQTIPSAIRLKNKLNIGMQANAYMYK